MGNVDKLTQQINQILRTGDSLTSEMVAEISRREEYGEPIVIDHLADCQIEKKVVDRVPRESMERGNYIPLQPFGDTLLVAMADLSASLVLENIKWWWREDYEKIAVVKASREDIHAAIEKFCSDD